MILAGIDEAGLGPTLGPLTSARVALRVPDDWTPDTPWGALAGVVAPAGGKGESRMAVADSKALHRTGNLAALELPVGAFACLAHGGAPQLDCARRGSRHPCYSGGLAPFPVACPAGRMTAAAAALGAELDRAGAAVACLRIQALFEPEMNRLFGGGLNKNQVLLGETGRHLRALLDSHPNERVLAVVDKQGGRDDYLAFLTDLFPGAWVEVLETGRAVSRYRVRRAGAGKEANASTDAQILFQAKADANSFPTALASMAAKYARERSMAELNVWFSARRPGLLPTAGYPEDAKRWLADVRPGGEGLEVELAVRLR